MPSHIPFNHDLWKNKPTTQRKEGRVQHFTGHMSLLRKQIGQKHERHVAQGDHQFLTNHEEHNRMWKEREMRDVNQILEAVVPAPSVLAPIPEEGDSMYTTKPEIVESGPEIRPRQPESEPGSESADRNVRPRNVLFIYSKTADTVCNVTGSILISEKYFPVR